MGFMTSIALIGLILGYFNFSTFLMVSYLFFGIRNLFVSFSCLYISAALSTKS